MKSNRLNHLFCATALGSVVLLAVGCSEKKSTADVNATTDKTAAEPAAIPAAPMSVAVDQPGITADGWAAIKDDTFEQRTHFSAGLQTMELGMDGQIAAMNAKRGTMSGGMMGGSMMEVTAARTNLQSMRDKLGQATADTWTKDKDQVGQAWVRMQAACTKAQGS